MKKLRNLALVFLLLPSLAFGTPTTDLFTLLHQSTTYNIGIQDSLFYTQALRLLDDIKTNGSGGGGTTANITGFNGVAPSVGNGTTDTGTLRVSLSSDSTGQVKLAAGAAAIGSVSVSSSALPTGAATETTLSALNTKVTAVNTGAVTVASSALPTGASTSAKQAALGTAGTPSADVLTVQGVTSMTALKTDGSAVTQPVSGTVATNETPITSGGLTQYSLISAATTNATNVKASAGNVYSVEIFNNGVSNAYVKFYNSASALTAGAGTPVKRFMIPAGGGLIFNPPIGVQFSTGIGFTITGLLVDTDTTAVAINQVSVNIDYK